ncbi:MAG: NAD(P)-binding domain-containing protein [Steroidobacteraceae bacterium]|nr:NAD(P)-binding domain-containing protein [Steroidobacteraceae bacterium]
MKHLPCLLLAAVLAIPAHAAEPDDCIAIIGTGSVGGALGPRFAGLGERIVYGSRTPDEERVRNLVARTGARATAVAPAGAAAACGTIVLAVPWSAVEATIRSFGALDGKLIIDVTNPLGVRNGVEVAAPIEAGSMGELVQSLAPGAHVVKAFNTVYYTVMAHPATAGGPVSVLISGDDAGSKARVARLAAGIGFEPVDVGPLRTARYTEAMALLLVSRLVSGQRPFDFQLHPWPVKQAE